MENRAAEKKQRKTNSKDKNQRNRKAEKENTTRKQKQIFQFKNREQKRSRSLENLLPKALRSLLHLDVRLQIVYSFKIGKLAVIDNDIVLILEFCCSTKQIDGIHVQVCADPVCAVDTFGFAAKCIAENADSFTNHNSSCLLLF
jgi:predicted ATP-dependent protease